MKPPDVKILLSIGLLFVETLGAQSIGTSYESEIIPLQKHFVAQLTGHTLINDAIKLKTRSSHTERTLASNFLYESLLKFGFTTERHKYKIPNVNILVDLLFAPFAGENIYTTIPATTESEELIVFGAHYDSELGSPGAGDNAAGVALTYVVASELSKLKVRQRNFMVVFFDQEEENEIGSKAFARKLRKEGKNIHSVHIIDVVSWDSDNDKAVILQSPTPQLESIYQIAAAELSIPTSIVPGGDSDNKSFLDAGFNTIGVFGSDLTPHIHKSSDTLETVDFHYLASTTQLVLLVMKQLAEN